MTHNRVTRRVLKIPEVAHAKAHFVVSYDKLRTAALAAAEKDGSRIKPEYGSVWYHVMGMNKDNIRRHTTVAVPGATTQSTGLPDNGKQGGVWIMDAGTTTAHLMIPGY